MATTAEPKLRSAAPRAPATLLVLEPVLSRLSLEPLLLTPGSHTVGSGPDCSISTNMRGVEPLHCEIVVRDGRAQVARCDRRTWLNGGPASRATLRTGDRLVVGPIEFRVTAMSHERQLASFDDPEGATPPQSLPAASPSSEETRAGLPILSPESPGSASDERPHRAAATPAAPLVAVAPLAAGHDASLSRVETSLDLIGQLLADEVPAPVHPLKTSPLDPAPASTGLSLSRDALDRRLELLTDLMQAVRQQAESLLDRQRHLEARERSLDVDRRAVDELRFTLQRSDELLTSSRHDLDAAKSAHDAERRKIAEDLEAAETLDAEVALRLKELTAAEDEFRRHRDAQRISAEARETALAQRLRECASSEARMVERERAALALSAELTAESVRLVDARADLARDLDESRAHAARLENRTREIEQEAERLAALDESLRARRQELDRRGDECELEERRQLGRREEFEARTRALDEERCRLDRVADEQAGAVAELVRREHEVAERERAAESCRLDDEARHAAAVIADDKRAAFDAEQTRLAARAVELESLAASLNERSDGLDRREHAIHECEDLLRSRDVWLAAMDDAVGARELAASSAQSALEERRHDLQTRLELLDAETARITTLEAELDQRSATIARRAADLAARETALQESDVDLARRAIELDSRDVEHALRVAEFESRLQEESSRVLAREAESSRLAEIAERDEELKRWRRELESQAANLDIRAQELRDLAQSLDAGECEFAERSHALEARVDEFADRNRQFEEQVAELDARRRDLDALAVRLEAAERELTERAAEIDRRVQQRDDDDVERSRRIAELESRRLALDDLAAQLASDDRELTERLAELDARVREFADRNRQFEEQAAETDARRRDLAALAVRLEATERELTDRADSLDAQRREIDSGNERLARLLAEVDVRRIEVDELAARLETGEIDLAGRLGELDRRIAAFEPLEMDRAAACRDVPFSPGAVGEDDASHRQLELADERRALDEMRARLEAESARLETEKAQLESDRQSLRNDDVELEAARAEWRRLHAPADDALAVGWSHGPLGEADDSELPELPAPFAAFRHEIVDVDHDAGEHEDPRLDLIRLERREHDLSDDLQATGVSEDSSGGKADGRVLELRSQLAELFDLRGNHAGDDAGGDMAAPSETRDDAPAELADEDTPDRANDIDLNGLMASLDRAADPEPKRVVDQRPSPRAAMPAAPEPVVDDIENEASVAQYMERLFARTRRQSGEPEPEKPSRAAPVAPVAPARETPRPSPAADVDDSEESQLAEATRPAFKEPKTRQERDAVRAHLDSLRQVANASARQAIDTHSIKRRKTQTQLKFALAGAAAVLAALLLSNLLWENARFQPAGWAFIGVFFIVAVDLAATWWKTRPRRLVASGAASTAAAGESSDAPLNDPSEEPAPQDQDG